MVGLTNSRLVPLWDTGVSLVLGLPESLTFPSTGTPGYLCLSLPHFPDLPINVMSVQHASNKTLLSFCLLVKVFIAYKQRTSTVNLSGHWVGLGISSYQNLQCFFLSSEFDKTTKQLGEHNWSHTVENITCNLTPLSLSYHLIFPPKSRTSKVQFYFYSGKYNKNPQILVYSSTHFWHVYILR